MLPNVNEIFRPESISEAVNILKKGKGKIAPLAGSTTIGASENPVMEGLADLSGLKLDYVKLTPDGLVIGAMATLEDIAENKSAQKYASGVVSAAAASVGKITNRNMITAGGNVVQVHPWSALPVVCLALGAKIIVASPAKKSVPSAEFFAKSPRHLLSYDGLVTEISFPKDCAGARAKYVKFALTENDYPLISVCVVAKLKNGKIETIRVVAGALRLLPQRLTAAESMLVGAAPDGKLVGSVSRAAADAAVIGNDIRVSKEYKKKALAKIIESALADILR
ncbi:MAG: FAD binding domain-containing protein [Endomicrobiia bacterium]|nr:FAD binding domain-containing protein [Endomicrobiia bacterium]